MTRVSDVLIVAKTHAYGGACIGGLDLGTQTSVRLLGPNRQMQPAHTALDVGQLWRVTYRPYSPADLIPPHIEDVELISHESKRSDSQIAETISRNANVLCGNPDSLFDGKLGHTGAGRGYIAKPIGVPGFSVQFWRPDARLELVRDDQGRRYYRYPGRSAVRELRYVGFANPVASIAKDSLVRVSLATWWSPAEVQDIEDKCYLQLSAWY